MNEERAGREGSSRDSGSGGSRDAFGAAGDSPGGAGAVPRQAEQGRAVGAGRRRAAGPSEFGAGELTAALQHSVSAIGAGGPPRAGLARIRRRAKARQRRRTVMAGSAGVLLLAMGVAAVTGRSFDIVPVLTGVVGLGGGSTSSGATGATPQSGGSGQVRTVLPPAASLGKKGPAIGPGSPSASASAAIAATGVPQCTAADLKTTASVDTVIGGVSYGHLEAVADTACAVAGPPVLQVQNAAGTAVGSVVILRQDSADGSALPNVPTWGAVLKLQAGQGYDFQFAWAPDSCAQVEANDPAVGGTSAASGQPSAAPSGTGSSGATASAANQNAQTAYSLSYLVAGVTPTAPVSLDASCGATVYVTDVYGQGGYPLPQPPTTPSPQPPASSAPAPSQSPTTQPPTSGAPTSTGSAPAATGTGSGAASSSQSATSSSAANPGSTSAANVTAADPASS
jgi:hypothetical protein